MKYTPHPHLCPVCGRYEFPDMDTFGICPICDWFDDGVYEDDPDYKGGGYPLSLNEARAEWRKKLH